MVRAGLRGLAALCLVVVTAILLAYVPTVYYDAPYLGALFIFGSIAMLGCALLIVGGNRNEKIERFGWALGAVIMLTVLAGFIASRTVGIISYHDSCVDLARHRQHGRGRGLPRLLRADHPAPRRADGAVPRRQAAGDRQRERPPAARRPGRLRARAQTGVTPWRRWENDRSFDPYAANRRISSLRRSSGSTMSSTTSSEARRTTSMSVSYSSRSWAT